VSVSECICMSVSVNAVLPYGLVCVRESEREREGGVFERVCEYAFHCFHPIFHPNFYHLWVLFKPYAFKPR